MLCRDEINRLIEIICSRAVDVPDQEKKYLTPPVKGDAERPIAALENPRKSVEEKQEDLSKALWGPSTTLLQSSVSRLNCYNQFRLLAYAWRINFVLHN